MVSKSKEAHGEHWSAVCPRKQDFSKALAAAVAYGRRAWHFPWPEWGYNPEGWGGTHLAIVCPSQGAVRTLAILNGNSESYTLYSAYPVACEGAKADVKILSVNPWGNGIEGTVTGLLGDGAEVAFFDPLFCVNRYKYHFGETVQIRLAAIGYVISSIPWISFDLPEEMGGAELRERLQTAPSEPTPMSMEYTVATSKIEEVGLGEWRFISPIGDTSSFMFNDNRIVQLGIRFHPLTTCALDALEIPLYVHEDSIKGIDKLHNGQLVRGTYWLQGSLATSLEELNRPTPLLSSPEATAGRMVSQETGLLQKVMAFLRGR